MTKAPTGPKMKWHYYGESTLSVALGDLGDTVNKGEFTHLVVHPAIVEEAKVIVENAKLDVEIVADDYMLAWHFGLMDLEEQGIDE